MPEWQPPGESPSAEIAPGITGELLNEWRATSGRAVEAIDALNNTAAQIVPSIALTERLIGLAESAMDHIGPIVAHAVRVEPDTPETRGHIEGLAGRLDGFLRRLTDYAPVLNRLPATDGAKVSQLLTDLRNEIRA